MATTHFLCRWTLPLVMAAALQAADPAPAINGFATSAYRELGHGNNNLIFSPFSISTVLSMVLQGARGSTAEQIAAVLHLMRADQEYPAAQAALVNELTKGGNSAGNQLHLANGLWMEHDLPVLPDFRKVLETHYGAPPSGVDFSHNPEQARMEINAWTEKHTKGRIRDLFTSGSIDEDTRLVLTSAIYFYGKWNSAFAVKDTRPAAFRLSESGSMQTSFMNRTGSFGYAETPSAQVLEMPYAQSTLAFDVILPKEVNGLSEIERSLAGGQLSSLVQGIRSRTVQVSLPKFRAESEFSLGETLARMGMPQAFSRTADFSGIDGKKDLRISDVKHKAYVDVAEAGTEAAAASGAAVALISMAVPQHVIFKADHPFLFLIRDTRSGTILFAGRLLRPKA